MTPRDPTINAIVRNLLAWFSTNARDLPWRRSRDPYAVFVSEIMLQQTQVKTVIPYFERWMRAFPDLRSVARASPDQLNKLWEGLGYYRRVRHLQQAALVVLQKHGGRFPQDFGDVLALPGIGRYTAGAICSIAYGQPTPILDGNVARVLSRLYGITGQIREPRVAKQLWDRSLALVQSASVLSAQHIPQARGHPDWLVDAPVCSRLNQSLMELGALVCTPASPRCQECPVQKLCLAFRTGRVMLLPTPVKRPPPVGKRVAAFVVEHRGRFLVHQRPVHSVNGGLWEFPNTEILKGGGIRQAAQSALGLVPDGLKRRFAIRHSITRFRIELVTYSGRLPQKTSGRLKPTRLRGNWVTPDQITGLTLPSAHRRIAQRLVAATSPSASKRRPNRKFTAA